MTSCMNSYWATIISQAFLGIPLQRGGVAACRGKSDPIIDKKGI